MVWHPSLKAVPKQRHELEVYGFFTNVNVGAMVPCSLASTQFPYQIVCLSTDCTVSQAMAHTTNKDTSGTEAAEAAFHETSSSFKRSAPTDENVDFDPKQCQWVALRDVIYAKHNTKMNPLDICKALKVLYPDDMQFQNMSSQDIEKMFQWWNDPSYPYRHRPLYCGPKSYESVGLRLKHALSPPETATSLAAAPVTPIRTASPLDKPADIPLPPRHPPRDSIFTTEGSSNPKKTETRRRYDREAAKQRGVAKLRKVKTKDILKDYVKRQQSSNCSTNINRLKIAIPPLQHNKASTYSAENSRKPISDHRHSTHLHAEDYSTSVLGSPPHHLPVKDFPIDNTLQSKAIFQPKQIKPSLVLPPPPQLVGFYSVDYPKLPAKSNPNKSPESGHSPSPTYGNNSTPPDSPAGSASNSRPAKRRALAEKPTNIWQRNGAAYEQLPSISSLFLPEHWIGMENLCLKPPIAGPSRIAGQKAIQMITNEHGASSLPLTSQQDRPVLLPPLELRTPSVPSLSSSSTITPTNSSSAVTPTSSSAEKSTTTLPSTPSLPPLIHSNFIIKKRYSEGKLKYISPYPSVSLVRKLLPEGSLKFSPSACPWLAIRDVAFAKARMNLPKEQIALLLSHRYGNAYPFLKQVTSEQVQELWESGRTCREALYTEQDCGVVEQQIGNDLRMLGLRG